MEGWYTQEHFYHLQTSTLCIKTKEIVTFLCWPQLPQSVWACGPDESWMEGVLSTLGIQRIVSAARLGTLGLQQLCRCSRAQRWCPGAQIGPAPSLQQMIGRACLMLSNIAGSSLEMHKRRILSLVPRQWEERRGWNPCSTSVRN